MEDSQGSNPAGAPATKRKSSASKLTIIFGLGICLAAIGFVVSLQPFFKFRSERALISATLKDPDSAKFSNEKLDSTGYYCGEVNSKNSYGGFAGIRRVMIPAPYQIFFQDGSFHTSEDEKRVSNERGRTDYVILQSESYTAGVDIEIEALKGRNNAYKVLDKSGSRPPPPLSEFRTQIFQRRWEKSCKF